MSDSLLFSVALSILKNSRLKKVYPLINEHDAEDIFYFLKPDFRDSISGFVSKIYGDDILSAASKIISTCGKWGYTIIPVTDAKYPSLLREIYDPPVVLYAKGNLNLESPVAVVGTRNSDSLSADFTLDVSKRLSSSGCEIISGMAKGIDRFAHCGAVNYGGHTVGVLANGIDIRYPAENNDLYTKIETSDGSSLVSEYPPGVFADRWTFVRRNRIISGMSCVTLVIKASEKSGAMITARYSVDQNREVFACPGMVFDQEYAGCNSLIRQGASIFTSVDDVLESVSLFLGKLPKKKAKSGKKAVADDFAKQQGQESGVNYEAGTIEHKIIDSLRKHVHFVDDIARSLELESGLLKRKIIEMELDGSIIIAGSKIMLAAMD